MIIVTDSERKIRLPFSRGILTRSITLAEDLGKKRRGTFSGAS
ncbi:MAG: hypothetical protein PWQ95_1714 [Thermococcaceae archaeon]|nr:hypothetical protein [Thermococcaceae archaeon]